MTHATREHPAEDLTVGSRTYGTRRNASGVGAHENGRSGWQTFPPISPSKLTASFVMPLEATFEEFLFDCESRNLTKKTLRYYRQQLRPFLDTLQKQQVVSPADITAHDIRTYLLVLKERGLSSASQHSAARAIRAFCNFMVREGLIEKSPMDRVQMPRVEKKIMPALTSDNVYRLLATCTNVRDQAIVSTLLDSGCRASEFVSLNMSDIDLRNGRVLVREGKGNKQRVAFLGKRTRKLMRTYIRSRDEVKADEPLWLSLNSSERLTDSGLRQLLQRLGRRAGVAHSNPHTLRRTFAVFCLRAGMDVFRLQQLLGHSDLAMVRRYLSLVEDDLESAHRSYGPVDRMFESTSGAK